MNDNKMSTTKTFAWIAWALSGQLLVAAWAVSGNVQTTTDGMILCTLAIILAAAAATLHTRSYFCAFAHSLKEAFDVGRQTGRTEVPLQRVHG